MSIHPSVPRHITSRLKPLLRLTALLLLAGPQRPVRRVPLPAKREARVQSAQQQHGKRHHRAVQDQEIGLGVPQLALEAFPQLCGAEDRSGEDREGREQQRGQEGFEDDARADCVALGRGVVGAVAADADEEVEADGEEDAEGDGLQHETGDHDVDAGALEGLLVEAGCVCDSAARCLQDEGQEVGCHEGEGDSTRGDTGE